MFRVVMSGGCDRGPVVPGTYRDGKTLRYCERCGGPYKGRVSGRYCTATCKSRTYEEHAKERAAAVR